MVEELIFRHNLSLSNRRVTSTFITRRASSIIDLTLCSSNIFESVRRWKVNKDNLCSDHRRIEFTLEGLDCKGGLDQWALKGANWQAFQAFIKAKSERFRTHRYWTPTTLDTESIRLESDIKTSLSGACENSRPRPRPSQRWWWSDLEAQSRLVRQLHKMALKKGPDDKIWDNYKTERNKLKAMIQRAKRESWTKFTSETSNVDEMANLMKAIFRKEVKENRPPKEARWFLHKELGRHPEHVNGLFLPKINTSQGS